MTYRLVQDYIENFFSCIRSRGGFNSNPTALQFEIAYKYMLIHTEIRSSENGNCEMDNIEIFEYSSAYKPHKVNAAEVEDDIEFDFPQDIIDDENVAALSAFVKEVVKHISGFVSQKVRQSTKCNMCKEALTDPEFEEDCWLLFLKNVGGLTAPASFVTAICLIAETEFRRKLRISNNFSTFIEGISNVITNSFKIGDEITCLQEHKSEILASILKTYVNIRIHYECKKLSLPNKKPIRQKLNKLTQNLGQ
jgi:hypothetical protein